MHAKSVLIVSTSTLDNSYLNTMRQLFLNGGSIFYMTTKEHHRIAMLLLSDQVVTISGFSDSYLPWCRHVLCTTTGGLC
jgi:hypothetical protein